MTVDIKYDPDQYLAIVADGQVRLEPATVPPPKPEPTPEPEPSPEPDVDLPDVIDAPAGKRHEYSDLQVWSPDLEYVLLRDEIYTWPSLKPVRKVWGACPVWANTRPHSVLSYGDAERWMTTDAATGEQSAVNFTNPIDTTISYQQPSKTHDRRASYTHTRDVYIRYGSGEHGAWPLNAYVNFVAMCPTRDRVFVQFDQSGEGRHKGAWLYYLDGQPIRQITTHGHHGCLGYDAIGDYFCTFETAHPQNNNWPGLVWHYLHDEPQPPVFCQDAYALGWNVMHLSALRHGSNEVLITTRENDPKWKTTYPHPRSCYLATQEGIVEGTMFRHGQPASTAYYDQAHGSLRHDGKWMVCDTAQGAKFVRLSR